MKLLIIDNYDSFTFNLYQYSGEILSRSNDQANGQKPFEVLVKRNDELSFEQVADINAERIIISPGPGSPDNPDYFGVCKQVITELGKTTPLLGICLGMQGIAYAFGGEVVRSPIPMHGKTSDIQHNGQQVFKGLPQPLEVMRYHSLMVNPEKLPDCLEVTATVEAMKQKSSDAASTLPNEIMGVRHKQYPIQGVQFHPESFATEAGMLMLSNFLYQE
ncbi:MAG: aminodeoxychorismate/anthranilate synthase component II [Pseudomonadales bacterium]|nr:aminodeoxychorismate/anthranilate synthase component II [Pseudomonadales bacterium]